MNLLRFVSCVCVCVVVRGGRRRRRAACCAVICIYVWGCVRGGCGRRGSAVLEQGGHVVSCRCEFCDEHASVERRSSCVFERGVKLRCTRGCGAFSKIAISHSLSIALSHINLQRSLRLCACRPYGSPYSRHPHTSAYTQCIRAKYKTTPRPMMRRTARAEAYCEKIYA